jgi:hypothetical protein
MRPDDRDLDALVRRARARLLRERRGTSGRRRRSVGTGLDSSGNAGDETVGASRPNQGHARRQPVATKARGNGDRAEVEQVDEVGVGPEPRIDADWVGLNLGDGVEARHGRKQHCVELRPRAARPPLLIGEPIERLERGDGVEPPSSFDNRAGDGMQSLRIAFDQRPGRGIALGDPGTFVERSCDLGERLEVELDDSGAK